MKQYRQNSYVERELRIRRIERRQRIIGKIKDVLAGIVLIICFDAFFLSMFLI